MSLIVLARVMDAMRQALARCNAEPSDLTLTIDGTDYWFLVT